MTTNLPLSLSLALSSLIFMAIEDSNEKALPVKEIYAWIVQHFPYFKSAPNGWKNSVRHNLSLNKSFVKVEKAPNMGKGSLWRVEPQQRQNLMQALNRSPYFPNSAVDKISPMLKSPGGNGAAGVVGGVGYDGLDGSVASAAPPPAVSGSLNNTPIKSNGALANGGAGQTGGSSTPTSNGNAAASRFDPKLYPNLSKKFRNISEELDEEQQLSAGGDYLSNNNNNNSASSGNYNYASSLNGSLENVAGGGGGGAVAALVSSQVTPGAFTFERLQRDGGADGLEAVHAAAAAMLFLKHGSKAISESYQNG